jgi:hypothetical protein
MPKFRKKPDNSIYEVEQYTKKNPRPKGVCTGVMCGAELYDHVHTAHDQVVILAPNDWIMPEPDGRGFYPIKPDIFADRYEPADAPERPIDMIIFCPNCHKQHIDRADEVCGSKVFDHTCRRRKHHTGPCSTADEKAAWTNPVHKSHTCRKDGGGCGTIFRVADVPTNGVKNIETKGKDDTWSIHVQSTGD